MHGALLGQATTTGDTYNRVHCKSACPNSFLGQRPDTNKLSAEYSFATTVDFTFPKIKIFEQNEYPKLTAAFKTLETPQIRLDAVINQTLEDGIIFKSESDKIVYDLQNLGLKLQSQFSWSGLASWITNPFSFPTNLCIIVMIAAIIYLFIRVRSLVATIVLLQRVQPVQVQTFSFQQEVEEFVRQKQIRTITAMPFFNLHFKYEHKVSNDFHVLDLLILLTIISICFYLLWRNFRRRQREHTFEIVLEEINRYDRVKIQIAELPLSAESYTFTATEFISHLSLRGSKQPKLHIHWPTLKIKHRLLAINTDLPPIHSINYWTAFKLRRLLSCNYEVLLFTRELNTDIYQLVPLLGSTWNSLQTDRPTRSERPMRATQSLMLTASDVTQYV
jgi:hypothetical protein